MREKIKQQRIIGLTGGIATGKTTVTTYLKEKYNLLIFDADILAREAVKKDSPILGVIFNRYGNKIQLENGDLNRPLLGEIIFNNAQEKHWLESQIHPYVREELLTGIYQNKTQDIIILSIPLLFEAKMTDLVTEIWVVTCTELQQKQRLIQRNNLSEKDAEIRIKNQLPLEFKTRYANIILDNSTTLTHLKKQIDQAIKK